MQNSRVWWSTPKLWVGWLMHFQNANTHTHTHTKSHTQSHTGASTHLYAHTHTHTHTHTALVGMFFRNKFKPLHDATLCVSRKRERERGMLCNDVYTKSVCVCVCVSVLYVFVCVYIRVYDCTCVLCACPVCWVKCVCVCWREHLYFYENLRRWCWLT